MSAATPAQTILVVEDESSIASFVSLYLKNAGYVVRTASTGGDALNQVGHAVTIRHALKQLVGQGFSLFLGWSGPNSCSSFSAVNPYLATAMVGGVALLALRSRRAAYRQLATIKGGENYLTLQEALEQKKVVVYETGNVNELSIENVGDQPVFIQSGDIVKGGRQDRTLGTDMIVSAHSGKLPIAAFCVEHGRWTGRAGEVSQNFGASADMVATPAMKLAANVNTGYADQSVVWSSVSENQQKLAMNAGGTIEW